MVLNYKGEKMNYVVNLYVRDIKNINRTIIVNDNISIQLFIKSVIVSMNGSTNALYLLQKDNEDIELDRHSSLSSLNLEVKDHHQIIYSYDDKPWILEFVILEKKRA